MDATAKQDTLANVQVDSTNIIQSDLIKIWEDVFNRQISPEDDFFQLGGDSIGAMSLVSKINRKFGVLLQIEEIFENSSFAYQLNRIENKHVSSAVSINRAPDLESYPLANTQKSFYTINQLNPNSISGNVPLVIKVIGGLNVEFCQKSILEIIRRHDMLRTAFRIEGAKVVQEVLDDIEFEIVVIERKDESMRELMDKYVKPFDLAVPPLFRIFAVRKNDTINYLIFDSHHIISDLISINVFLNELITLAKGDPLNPLKIQYKDFAYWQQKQLPEIVSKQKDFWMDTFDKVPPKINLPTDPFEEIKTGFKGDTYKFEFEKEEIFRLKELCKKEKVTQFTFVMALFYVFLHKISNQDDLVVALSSHGRKYPELHDLIGVFVNTLPVRMKIDPNLSFSTFLEEFKQQVPKYFANEDFSYDLILQHLRANNIIKFEGLFNVMFEYHIVNTDESHLSVVDRPLLVPKCDLALQVGERGTKELVFFVEYAKNIFRRDSIIMLSKYFSSLMKEVIECIDIEISDISSFTNFKEAPHKLDEKYHKIDKIRHFL